MVMPEVSLTSAEVKLVSWLKKPGDAVKRGEPLVEVETDKATVEVESYVDGFLRVTNFPDGATVPLDAVIAILTTTPDEQIEDLPVHPADADAPAATVPALKQLRPPVGVSKGRIDITPVARKLAEDNHIDLASLQGSGPEGRITRADVEAALEARGIAPASGQLAGIAAVPAPGISSMRNAIAQRTALSKATIPHYYVSIDIDMQAVLRQLSQMKDTVAAPRIDPPTLTDVIIWACGRILPDYPLLHGTWSDGGPRVLPEISIGMVVGLDDGLIVPVIHEVDRLSLSAVAATTRTLKKKAKQGGLSNRELTGGRFTVSNLGMFGVSSFIAVINPPESAILALGATIKRAVVGDNDQVIVRPVMTATLSVDHRMIDGIVAAGFLKALKEILEASSSLSRDL
ncbi:MAG: hypothetical protein A2139_11245 [Desulfobacca sp. RBG_16_60_12]|nr:MAG: hypothetical protein A2139_11245 [Desulfobacca sp. RBG_16_60_12]